MTVIGYSLLGASGAHSYQRGATYRARYRVDSDNALDGPQTILYWVRANIAGMDLGDPYQFADDGQGGIFDGAFLQDIECPEAPVEAGRAFHWFITGVYGPQSSDKREPDDDKDESGTKTDDPTAWRFQINSGSNLYTENCYEATYMGGYSAGIEGDYGFTAGTTRMLPSSSALVPYEPKLEVDRPTGWLTLRKNVESYDGVNTRKFLPSMNNAKIRPKAPYSGWFNEQWEENELRFDGVNVAYRRRQRSNQGTSPEKEYMELEFNFTVRRAIFDFSGTSVIGGTWDEFVIDAGTLVKAVEGDPDGKGGFIGPLQPGQPGVRRLLDVDAVPLGQQVHLDGDGQVLEYTPGGAAFVPKKIQWRKYERKDFLTIPVVGSFFEAVP